MGQAYSDDFRKCVIDNYRQGKRTAEILAIFGIGSSTLKRWLREYRATGNLRPHQRHTDRARKFSDTDVLAYVKEHPSATLAEMAHHLSVTHQSVWSRLNRLGITRKKKHFSITNAMNSNANNLLLR